MQAELSALRKAVDDIGGIIVFDENQPLVGEITILLPNKVPLDAAKCSFIDVVDE